MIPVGTKTLLWGVHQPLIHTWFVAAAWGRLYGWRDLLKPGLWAVFALHDLGYWGCENLDGPEGTLHPVRSARLASRLRLPEWVQAEVVGHSRRLCAWLGYEQSRLCAADKLATALYPRWLWLGLARASGELREYLLEGARLLRQVQRGERRATDKEVACWTWAGLALDDNLRGARHHAEFAHAKLLQEHLREWAQAEADRWREEEGLSWEMT